MKHGFRARVTPPLTTWVHDEYFTDYDYADDDDYYERDEDEIAMEECGQTGDGWANCLHAGSEHCDFDCPFRDIDLGVTGGGGRA